MDGCRSAPCRGYHGHDLFPCTAPLSGMPHNEAKRIVVVVEASGATSEKARPRSVSERSERLTLPAAAAGSLRELLLAYAARFTWQAAKYLW